MRTDLRHFPEKERLFMQRSLSLFTQNFIFVVYATGSIMAGRHLSAISAIVSDHGDIRMFMEH